MKASGPSIERVASVVKVNVPTITFRSVALPFTISLPGAAEPVNEEIVPSDEPVLSTPVGVPVGVSGPPLPPGSTAVIEAG